MTQLPTGTPPVAPDAPVEPVAPVEPQPGTAEYNTQVAMLAPSMVPAKFRRPDGTVDQALLLESYKQLEQHQRGQTPDPTAGVPAPNAAAALDTNVADPAPAPTAGTVDEILTQEKPATPTINWEAVRSGNVSKEDLAALKEKGIPDDVIAGYAKSIQDNKAAAIKEVSDAVGGEETLKTVLVWAQKTKSETEWNALRTAVSSGGQAKMLLMGLHAEYLAANPQSNLITPADGGVGAVDSVVQPYASQAEMSADMGELDSTGKELYSYDPKKQRAVALRIYVTKHGTSKNFDELYKPVTDY